MVEAVKRPLEQVDEAVGARRRARARAGARPRRQGGRSSAAFSRRLDVPAVVDADALFELEPATGRRRASSRRTRASSAGCSAATRRGRGARLASVREAAEKFDAVVVLKGEDSLVAAPGGGVLVCALGLPSLATAGTGDVLTGITAAFLAKGMEPQRAAPRRAPRSSSRHARRSSEPASSRATWSRRCRQFSALEIRSTRQISSGIRSRRGPRA